MPAYRPQKITGKSADYRQQDVAVINVNERPPQLAEFDLPEKQHHKEQTDADAKPEL